MQKSLRNKKKTVLLQKRTIKTTIMNKSILTAACASLLCLTTACTSHYKLTNTSRTRIVVDNRYDNTPDKDAALFIEPYKHKVDSAMGPVVGIVAHDMAADRPESDLSNLLSDILVWGAKDYGEKPVLGIYNMGGIRASLSKGKVTFGDVLDVAPFENKICFLTLTGEKLLELFAQIAAKGGEGVSRGTELVITSNGKLISAQLHGKSIDPKGSYRISTIDYLAQGNDGLTVLKEATDLVAPSEESNNTRYIIINYFKDQAAKKQPVSAQVEGRIRVVNE
jgi:2',3'-cyclic-nucleotide 2'-phosphodiesterase (5'-nucleotidase family)